MIKKLVACAAILGAFAVSAHAADSKGDYIVRGVGMAKCSDVMKDLSSPGDGSDARLGAAFGYVSGYFTAVNAYAYQGKDVLQGASDKSAVKAVLGWCSNHPDKTLDDATEALLQAIVAK